MASFNINIADIDAIFGSYGKAPPLSFYGARGILEKIYGGKVRFSSYQTSDSKHLDIICSDTPTILDLMSKVYFSGSPCIAFQNIQEMLEITKDLKSEEFRIIMVEQTPIVCFKDESLAMKVKLSIDTAANP